MDKLNITGEVRELKLGASFVNNRASTFHTLKCDFKPASVDQSKMASVEVAANSQVTVTVPHLDGSGVPQTVFKGNQRPYQKKECVLIIDRKTGEMTLERLSSNIQVKKTRQEPPHKPAPAAMSSSSSSTSSSGAPRPHTPIDQLVGNCTQRSQTRTRVTSGGRRGGSSATLKASPPRHRTSPPQAAPWSANAGQSTLASLPMIGLDDMPSGADLPPPQMSPPLSLMHSQQPQPPPQPPRLPHLPPDRPPPTNGHQFESRESRENRESRTAPAPLPPPPITDAEIGNLTSSSGSSSSDSDSDHSDSGGSDSEPHRRPQSNNAKPTSNGGMNGINLGPSEAPAMQPMELLLTDDLHLSESSGSDCDD